jgi:hypothetical protein
MTLPKRISYGFMAVMLILIGWLGLTTPLLTVLFSMFALHCLHHSRSKWLTVALFVVLVSGIFYSFIHFAGRTIPVVLDYAQKQGLQLPFEDVASLKTMLLDEVKGELGRVGYYAKLALWEFAAFLIGLVVAISMFLNAKFDLGEEQHAVKDNLYSLTGAEIAERFRTFFRSFATVMGAQIVISSINTVLTGFYLFWIELPYAHHREHSEQHPDRRCRADRLPAAGAGLAGLPRRHPQARILPQQQDHRGSHQEPHVAHLARAGPGGTVDGHPGHDPGARGAPLHQGRGFAEPC